MNIARHMRRLNDLLASELGNDPLYKWVWSEDPEFRHAMQKKDEFGQPTYNYRCACGLNRSVHSATCTLTVPEPIYEWRKIDISLNRQWVLCALKPPELTEAQWREKFGSALYPKHGEWMPVGTEDRTIALPEDQVPGDMFNLAVIRGRQRSRMAEDEPWDYEAAEDKRLADRRAGFVYRFKDVLPVRPNPGCVDGPVSLPTVSVKEKVTV